MPPISEVEQVESSLDEDVVDDHLREDRHHHLPAPATSRARAAAQISVHLNGRTNGQIQATFASPPALARSARA